MKLEQLWNDVAAIKKDRAALQQILAEEFFYTHSNGSVMGTKAQEIADTMTAQWTSSRTDDLKVRVFGDVAVVTGRQVLEGTAKASVDHDVSPISWLDAMVAGKSLEARQRFCLRNKRRLARLMDHVANNERNARGGLTPHAPRARDS